MRAMLDVLACTVPRTLVDGVLLYGATILVTWNVVIWCTPACWLFALNMPGVSARILLAKGIWRTDHDRKGPYFQQFDSCLTVRQNSRCSLS